MAENFKYRRLPYADKKIAEISPENDIRVRVLGRIIDKDSCLVVDDGTSKAEIVVDMDELQNVNVGDTVRVFTRVLPLEDGYELRGEIIQKMNDLNVNLYNKVKGKEI